MEFTRNQLNECIVVNEKKNIELSDSEVGENGPELIQSDASEDSVPIPKKQPIYSAFNELQYEDLREQLWKCFKLLPQIKKKQLGELVRAMMEKGYTSFTEISEHYVYSFTHQK